MERCAFLEVFRRWGGFMKCSGEGGGAGLHFMKCSMGMCAFYKVLCGGVHFKVLCVGCAFHEMLNGGGVHLLFIMCSVGGGVHVITCSVGKGIHFMKWCMGGGGCIL